MKKQTIAMTLALCMVLVLLPRTAHAKEEFDFASLLRQGETNNMILSEEVTFEGQNILSGMSIYMAKEIMDQNGLKSTEITTSGSEMNVSGWAYDNDTLMAVILVTQMSEKNNIAGFAIDAENGSYPVGLRNVMMYDSVQAVFEKLGFSNFATIAQAVHRYDTGQNSPYLWDQGFNPKNGESYYSFGFYEDGPGFELHIGFYPKNGIKLSLLFKFEEEKLTWYQVILDFDETVNQRDNTPIEHSEFKLPTENLEVISDIPSAVKAVDYLVSIMTDEQKTSPDCIDLATLYVETASSKAASQSVASNNILVNVAALSGLESTVVKASEAVETALTDGGVITARYLSKTVTLRTEENDITVYVDPDALTTAVDKVRVETPSYALIFKLADLAPDLTQALTFRAKSAVASSTAPSATVSSFSSNADYQTITRSILANAAVPAVEIDMPGGKTTNSITVSLPSGSGDTTYQAVASVDGQATTSKYNPATTTMDGKVNTSGTYTVKTNEKDFTDIANKSAEMQKAIRYLASKGIISGTTATTFSPDGNINRAEIATLLVKALGKLDSTATASFSDVTKGNWFYTAAASSQRHKLINGYEDNTFRGTTNISKVQIVAVSSRVLKAEMGYKEPALPVDYLSQYNDSVAGWAQPEVALATKENLVVYRTDGTFSGDKTMTRGDAAIIIYRVFQRIW